jgi:hypothetical protein
MNTLYMVLSGFFFIVLFLIFKIAEYLLKSLKMKQVVSEKNKLKDDVFRELQMELFGGGVSLKDSLTAMNHSSATPKSMEIHSTHIGVDSEYFA